MSDKAIYHCPCCDYVTHFPKALEAHQSFRKHFKTEPGKAEEPVIVPVIEPEEQKKTKKPRKAEKE